MDNILALNLFSPDDIVAETRLYFKALRLAQGWTQDGLAARSGLSLGSLKRFETTGRIAYDSLLQLAFALGKLDRFHDLVTGDTFARPPQSLDDLLAPARQPRRGRRK